MKNCMWHECGKAFEPTDPRQEFCGPKCRKARGAWKARRGGPLVDMLLANDADGLMKAKRKIHKEIKNAASKTD